ncbi:MAG: DUF2269 family protein [Pseudorhodoplanes sp.]|uniref:DUF2269 family protein n=1 Tax=Pseudorhodoplanes sp. TaxID=1934341 RepID=UPI003D096753
MPELYHLLKLAHIIGAAVLFGTGIGIAFFMLMAHRSRNVSAIAPTATIVVIADAVFTASAVVVQPITGIALAHVAGHSLLDSWIVASALLYVFVGLCWLPVLWLQKRMRDLALAALRSGKQLPADYDRYFRYWFILGWPAFAAMMAIFWLMITRPQLW